MPSGSLASGELGAVPADARGRRRGEARAGPPGTAEGQAGTPYLEAVAGYVRREPARFHVPGHKGGAGADPEARSTLGDDAFLYDVPQDIEGIDVGPSPTPSERAELLAAEAYGAAQSWFLTNGATQGNHALCLALARERPVVVQRNSHASVVDGLVLSGGRPHFAVPEYDDELGMALCVTPQALAEALDGAPHAGAAFVVSPTYYGASADIAACARVCHERGAALLVDQAWGPHFGFHPSVPRSALALGADAMLTSTHKIAGSLTQSAILHVADSPWIDRGTLARAVRLVRSTSPSSLLLASLDAARRQLAVDGDQLLGRRSSAPRGRARPSRGWRAVASCPMPSPGGPASPTGIRCASSSTFGPPVPAATRSPPLCAARPMRPSRSSSPPTRRSCWCSGSTSRLSRCSIFPAAWPKASPSWPPTVARWPWRAPRSR